MALVYGNRVSFLTTTTGTGTINVGSPVALFQLPAGASIASGSTVGYTIIDTPNWEVGTGIYTTGSPPTLSRATVEDSSSGPGVYQSLSGNATVSFVVTAAMYALLAPLASPALTGTPTAPTASSGTSTTQIATTAFVAPAFNDIGRNKIHNPLMNIAQRGVGAFSATGYTLDRWIMLLNIDTMSVTQQTFSDAQRVSIGDEEATNAFVAAITGSSTAAAFSMVAQYIENVRRLANKTVTVSFVAYAISGTPKIGVGLRQSLGSGGSPSIVDINATAVTISTTPTRYSVTITLGSLSGSTVSGGNDFTRLAFFFSSAANNNALAGGIGVQAATFVLWGVQLEIGSVMSPLEKPDSFFDLANCQRFYQIGNFSRGGYIASTVVDSTPLLFPVPMRAAPSVTPSFSTQTNCASSTTTGITANGFSPQTTGSSTAVFSLVGSFTASADLYWQSQSAVNTG